ncbi:MAG: hypothetical protein AAGA11_16545 [Pseudomonadota bacterium]
MDWTLLLQVVLAIAIAVMVVPGALRMARNAPKGSGSDWMGAAMPLIAVLAFVLLLISFA